MSDAADEGVGPLEDDAIVGVAKGDFGIEVDADAVAGDGEVVAGVGDVDAVLVVA